MTSTGPNTNTSHASGESHPLIIISTPVQQNTWDDEKNQQIVNSLSWQPGCSTSELSRITDWPQNLYRRQNYFPPCNFQIDFQFKTLLIPTKWVPESNDYALFRTHYSNMWCRRKLNHSFVTSNWICVTSKRTGALNLCYLYLNSLTLLINTY